MAGKGQIYFWFIPLALRENGRGTFFGFAAQQHTCVWTGQERSEKFQEDERNEIILFSSAFPSRQSWRSENGKGSNVKNAETFFYQRNEEERKSSESLCEEGPVPIFGKSRMAD